MFYEKRIQESIFFIFFEKKNKVSYKNILLIYSIFCFKVENLLRAIRFQSHMTWQCIWGDFGTMHLEATLYKIHSVVFSSSTRSECILRTIWGADLIRFA